MENMNISILIAGFVALIIGISLIGVIATESNSVTNIVNISGENITYTEARNITAAGKGEIVGGYTFYIANIPTGWRATDCPITGLILHNGSVIWTDVDYNFTASTGAIMFNNSANVNDTGYNTTAATYQYCPEAYLTEGWQRTIINLVPGFFALALLGVGIGLFYEVGRREGIW